MLKQCCLIRASKRIGISRKFSNLADWQFVGKLMISDHQATVRMLQLLLILFQTSMIYIGIFVFCRQIEGSAAPTIFFSFAPVHRRYFSSIIFQEQEIKEEVLLLLSNQAMNAG